MNEMMTFPDTWEEFEKLYGFIDNEEIYTNGVRLIPSFRVKQWLDHLSSVQSELSNNGELISRQAAIDAFWKLEAELRPSAIDAVLNMLKYLPSAQPKKGEWVKTYRDGFGNLIGYCSKCGRRYPVDSFCANCGADMRGSLNV